MTISWSVPLGPHHAHFMRPRSAFGADLTFLQEREEHLALNDGLQSELQNTKHQLYQLQQDLETARQRQQDSVIAAQQEMNHRHAAQVQDLQDQISVINQQVSQQQLQAESAGLQAADMAQASDLLSEMNAQLETSQSEHGSPSLKLANADSQASSYQQNAARAQQEVSDLSSALQKAEASLKAQRMSQNQA